MKQDNNDTHTPLEDEDNLLYADKDMDEENYDKDNRRSEDGNNDSIIKHIEEQNNKVKQITGKVHL